MKKPKPVIPPKIKQEEMNNVAIPQNSQKSNSQMDNFIADNRDR